MNRRDKIKAIADDPRADPATREIAQKMLASMPEPELKIHPGLRQSEEYQRWAKLPREANRRRATRST